MFIISTQKMLKLSNIDSEVLQERVNKLLILQKFKYYEIYNKNYICT